MTTKSIHVYLETEGNQKETLNRLSHVFQFPRFYIRNNQGIKALGGPGPLPSSSFFPTNCKLHPCYRISQLSFGGLEVKVQSSIQVDELFLGPLSTVPENFGIDPFTSLQAGRRTDGWTDSLYHLKNVAVCGTLVGASFQSFRFHDFVLLTPLLFFSVSTWRCQLAAQLPVHPLTSASKRVPGGCKPKTKPPGSRHHCVQHVKAAFAKKKVKKGYARFSHYCFSVVLQHLKVDQSSHLVPLA